MLSWLLAPWGAFGLTLALLIVAEHKTYSPEKDTVSRIGILTSIVAFGVFMLLQLGQDPVEFALVTGISASFLINTAGLLPAGASAVIAGTGVLSILTRSHDIVWQKALLILALGIAAALGQQFFKRYYQDYLHCWEKKLKGFLITLAGSVVPVLTMALAESDPDIQHKEHVGYVLTCLIMLIAVAWTLNQVMYLRLIRQNYRKLYEEHEKRLQQLIATLPGVAFVQDASGNYLEIWSDQTKDLQKQGLDWLGKNLQDFFSEEKLKERLELIRKALTSGKAQRAVFEATLKDGTPWIRELSLLPLDHERVLTVSTDIGTWLDKARRLQTIVQHSKELICVVTPDYRVDIMTPRALRELTGKEVQTNCKGLFDEIMNASDKALLEQHVRDIFLKKKEHANLEIRLYNKETQKATWVDVTITAMVEESSPIPRALLMVRDSSYRQFRENLVKGAALALEGLASPVAVIDDEEGRIEWANEAFLKLFELEAADSRKAPLDVLLSTSHTTKKMPSTLEMLKNPNWKGQFVSKTYKTGRLILHERRIRFIEWPETGHVWHVVQFEEIRAEKSLNERDHVTNTLTWAGLCRLVTTSAIPGNLLAVISLEINNLDDYVTSVSTTEAERLITQVAHRIHAHMPASALLARTDHAEFALVWNSFDQKQAKENVERILLGFEVPFETSHDMVYLSANAGIAISNRGDEPMDLLLHQARIARKEARKLGDNLSLTYSEEYAVQYKRKRVLEGQLRKALQQNAGLWVGYQPKVDMDSRRLVGFEALLRWYCEELKENVNPSEFVWVAEKSSLIDKLTIFVFESVCQQLKAWQEKQFTLLPIAVNLSAQQICDPGLPERLMPILRKHGTMPGLIELEVTESAVMHNINVAQQVLGRLRNIGFRVYLDDFGTGYTNMYHLQALPLDGIKIDASFVRGIGKPRAEQVCLSILKLAQGLSLDTVAEGVETEAQRAFLAQAGCTAFQGFLAAPALMPEEACLWLEHWQTRATHPNGVAQTMEAQAPAFKRAGYLSVVR